MKHSRKFNHQQYQRDLEEVERTLERVRSGSTSNSRIQKSSNNIFQENDVLFKTLKREISSKNMLQDNWKKKSNLIKTQSKNDWDLREKKKVPMLGEQLKNYQINDIKHRISRVEKPEVEKENWNIFPIQSTMKNVYNNKTIKKPQQQIFLDRVTDLYKIKERNNEDKLQVIIGQIQKRDNIYRMVQSKLSGQDSEDYQNLLEDLFRKQKLMMKIINVFKRMSKVDIEDLQELYDFLKEEEQI